MKIKAVLFDFDGTVIDTMVYYAEIASKILKEECGLDQDFAKRLYLSTAGRDFPTQLKLMGISGEKANRAYKRFLEEKKLVLRKSEISRYAIELIEKLKAMGLVTAVSTNNECHLVRMVRGIERFDEVLCFDGREYRKGLPHLLTLLGKYRLKEEEVLFIGDSDYDIEIYSKLGIRSLKTKGIFDEDEVNKILKEIQRMDDGKEG